MDIRRVTVGNVPRDVADVIGTALGSLLLGHRSLEGFELRVQAALGHLQITLHGLRQRLVGFTPRG